MRKAPLFWIGGAVMLGMSAMADAQAPGGGGVDDVLPATWQCIDQVDDFRCERL